MTAGQNKTHFTKIHKMCSQTAVNPSFTRDIASAKSLLDVKILNNLTGKRFMEILGNIKIPQEYLSLSPETVKIYKTLSVLSLILQSFLH